MIAFLALLFVAAQARQIQWSGRGGNVLWDNANNWDCSCLPTLQDDVVIAYSLGSTYIRIGQPAKAGTLTIGGSGTQFMQTLTVSGSLTIGGGVLNTNGALMIETSPTSPFNITGTFVANGRGLQFTSGLLGGSGTLRLAPGAFMNFSGAAAKEIAGTLQIDGSAVIASATGSSIFVKNRGSVVVNGNLEARTPVDIIVDNTSSFQASNGTVSLNAGPNGKFMFQGPFTLGKWNVQAGQVTVVNTLVSGALTLGDAATLFLIGGTSEQRTFTSISGGTVSQQGGSSKFNDLNLNSLSLSGGVFSITGKATTRQADFTGATFGAGSLNAAAASVSYAVLQGGAVLAASSLDLKGQVNLQDKGTSIVILSNGQMRVSKDSQITFINDNVFAVQQAATVAQGSVLKLVRASTTGVAPSIKNDGAWTVSSTLQSLGVSTSGSGSWALAQGGLVDFSNADFKAASASSQGKFQIQSGNVDIGVVTGSGDFIGQPITFSSQSFSARSFTLNDGTSAFVKSDVQQFTIKNGVASVSTTSISNLDFQGGTLQALGSSSATANVTTLSVTTTPAKTLKSITVFVKNLNLNCGGAGQCALLTINAALKTA